MGHAMMRLILLSLLIVFGHHAIRGIWGLDVLGIRKVDHVDRAQNDSYCKSSIISISSTDRVSFWNDFAIFRILFIYFFIMFIQFNTGIQRYTAHIACCGLPRPTQASQPHEHLAHLHCKLRFLVVTWLRRRVLKLRRIQAGARWNPKQKPTKKHADITPWSHLSKWGFRVQVLKMASKKSKKLPFQQNAWLRWKVTRQISWVLVGYLCRMWLVIDFRSKHFDHTIFGRQTIGIYGDDCPGCQVRHHARRQPCISTYQYFWLQIWCISVAWFFVLIDNSGGQMVKYFGLRTPFHKAWGTNMDSDWVWNAWNIMDRAFASVSRL